MPEAISRSRFVPQRLRDKLGIHAAVTVPILVKSALCTVRLKLRGVRCGPVRCGRYLPVIYASGSVRIGRAFGLDSRVAPIEIGATAGGRLVIGDRVAMASGTSIVASSSITVGDDVMIGDRVGIFDNDFHAVDMASPKRVAPVVLGARSWICRSSLIMPGVTVGEDSVVAAGSVVTKDVPPRTLVAGIPARVIRELQIEPGWRRSRID